jgi:hypothetical protein
MGRIVVAFFMLLIVAIDVKAQSSKSIPYQAVLRNTVGLPLAEKDVKVKTTILDSNTNGTVLYMEDFQVKTNPFGLFTINLGMGSKLMGNYANINWGQNDKFLKVEIDTTNSGTGYIEMSVQQLSSVPFALYAAKAGSLELGKMPTITTDSIGSVNYRSALLFGNFLERGSKVVFAKGFCLSEHENPSEDDSVLLTSTSLGNYRFLLENLIPGKTYHIRAFASSAAGTAYGADLSFNTLSLKIPELRTDTILNVSLGSGLLQATVLEDGGTSITERGFVWAEHSLPSLNDSSKSISLNGNFAFTLQGLKGATTYYVRAYSKNAQGTAYGGVRSFTTNNYTLPSISTSAATGILYRQQKLQDKYKYLAMEQFPNVVFVTVYRISQRLQI